MRRIYPVKTPKQVSRKVMLPVDEMSPEVLVVGCFGVVKGKLVRLAAVGVAISDERD